ncbi:hypothetical protein ACFQPA_13105 [Halomarina halobia]|uniref:Uncharacterized protein n=1 Tax=Halomarina halobia TaxID=3033386 RepID=A0ABD6AAD5_9EURY|nr:hypothetical protein [Halomarina sp. PSR21]
MRELVFAPDYEPGCNPVTDVLATRLSRIEPERFGGGETDDSR